MTDKINWLIRLTRMLHVALLFACFGVSMPAIAQIFVDEFDTNSIGTTWESVGTSLQTTPGTFTPVRIENGYAALEQNITDAGARLRLHAAKLPGGVFPRKFRLEVRHMMHPGGDYFYPGIEFLDATRKKYLGVGFATSVYPGGVCAPNGPTKVHVGGGHFTAPTVAGECLDGVNYYTNYQSSNYYDKWITTSFTYDQDTGAVSLDLGNDGSIEFSNTMPVADRPVIETLELHGYGWWTGHWQRVDYIKIFDLTQATASATVTSITPKTATLNVLQQFTITGTNLTSGMGFTIQDCDPSNQEVGTGTTTQRTFQCTPRGTTGTKYATIKTAPGGTVIPVAGAQTTPITITSATGLQAPVLSILPAATAAAGTSMTISFTTVANATSYKLCTGSAAGTYTGCAAIRSPYTFPMAAGFDKYMAVKAINTQGESAYSNELHLKSTTSAPTSLQAPVISIAPSATAATGTTLTLSFAPVPNATSYQLCYGSSSGNYAKCMPVTSPYSIKMTDGMDYYVAVKAVNTSLVSGYSNELHVVATLPQLTKKRRDGIYAVIKGVKTSTSLEIIIVVDDALRKQSGVVFVCAETIYNGDFCYTEEKGWISQQSRTLVPYYTGQLNNMRSKILDKMNISTLIGSEVYVGYGLSQEEMRQNNRYISISTLWDSDIPVDSLGE